MSPAEASRQFHATMNALRAGRITPDAMRAANRKLREDIGDAAYQRAKMAAICASNRA